MANELDKITDNILQDLARRTGATEAWLVTTLNPGEHGDIMRNQAAIMTALAWLINRLHTDRRG